jgi:tetratricopeptide (TPR) repeat protein
MIQGMHPNPGTTGWIPQSRLKARCLTCPVDSMPGAVENLNMRSFLAALLLCLIALPGLPVPLPGQHTVPEPGELESTYHYVPPSARQSVEIGDFYFRRKKYRGALSRYEEAARDDPYYAEAYLGMGKVYEKMGKDREALAAYNKYLESLPSKKQADEATDVQKAIHRLERELNQEHKSNRSAQAGATAAKR